MKNTKFDDLPAGKYPFPVKPNEVPFKDLKRYLDIEKETDTLEVKRDIHSLVENKLNVLGEVHDTLVQKARQILEQAKEDLKLHDIKMYAAKVRGNIYYLYEKKDTSEKFFSILEPEEYFTVEKKVSFLGRYRLNEDGTWTRLQN